MARPVRYAFNNSKIFFTNTLFIEFVQRSYTNLLLNLVINKDSAASFRPNLLHLLIDLLFRDNSIHYSKQCDVFFHNQAYNR